MAGLQAADARCSRSTKPKGAINCLVLLVDFSDNQGTKPPAHFENLLFDPTNPNSMAASTRIVLRDSST